MRLIKDPDRPTVSMTVTVDRELDWWLQEERARRRLHSKAELVATILKEERERVQKGSKKG